MNPDPFFRAALLATALRIERRRPAGWIALAAAAWSGWTLAVAPQSQGVAAAVAAGSLLAVAAIGSPPAGVPRGGRDPWAALGLLRVGWPVAGFMLTGSVAAAAFAVATALLLLRLLSRPSSWPGAASPALAIAGGAATVALIAAAIGAGVPFQLLAAGATWSLVAAGSLLDSGAGAWDGPATGLAAARHRWPEAGQGLAMATSLVAMVGCFFLSPGLAWAYTALAVGWFACLAVPAVLDVDQGPAGRRLLRAAAGRPLAPGTLAHGLRTSAIVVAILGWPALVAAVLPTADGGRVGSPLTAIVALAAAMLVCAIAASAASAAGGRPDAPRAVVFALVAVVAVGSAGVEGLTKHPVLPNLPASAGHAGPATGVEPSGPSCKTPHPS